MGVPGSGAHRGSGEWSKEAATLEDGSLQLCRRDRGFLPELLSFLLVQVRIHFQSGKERIVRGGRYVHEKGSLQDVILEIACHPPQVAILLVKLAPIDALHYE